MAKTNPRIEFLEKENRMLRAEIAKIRTPPEECPLVACDNSCTVTQPKGMGTNGGCRCDTIKLRSAIGWWRRYSSYLRATIEMMKHGDAVEQWDATITRLIESGHAPPGAFKE